MKEKVLLLASLTVILAATAGGQQAGKREPLQVAVYPFDAVGVEESVSTVITNAVFRELIGSGRLMVRDLASTQAAIEQLGLGQSGLSADDNQRLQVGKIIKAQKLVMGSVEKLEKDYYTIAMRIVDVETGRTEFNTAEDCPCSRVVNLRNMAAEMARKSVLPYLETGHVPAAQPATPTRTETTPAAPASPKGGEMVYVTAGEFMMGCNSEVDLMCEEQESPYHKVYLDAYYIDKYEVTVKQYIECVKAGKCDKPKVISIYTPMECNWDHPDRYDHPINCVNWQQAADFCGWAGKRLPTEAEWEKAARGTDGRIYPWGNEEATCEYAVMDEGGYGCGNKSTAPVGSRQRGVSPYGAYDMAGNVWEWTADYYDSNYYKNFRGIPAKNPKGPEGGKLRSLRGGAWPYKTQTLRTSNRYYSSGTYGSVRRGMRCAKSE